MVSWRYIYLHNLQHFEIYQALGGFLQLRSLIVSCRMDTYFQRRAAEPGYELSQTAISCTNCMVAAWPQFSVRTELIRESQGLRFRAAFELTSPRTTRFVNYCL